MLLWPEQQPVSNGKRWKPNPMPRVPATGWKPCDNFPSLAGAKAIAVDVETYDPEIEDHGPGWGRGKGHIIGISLATDDGFNKYFPIRHTVGFNHDPAQTIRYVREQLSRAYQPKVAHNALYDAGWLAHEGMPIVGQLWDTWTAEKLIDHSSSASLEETAQRYLGEGKSSDALYEFAWQAWGRGAPKSSGEKRKCAMKNLRSIPAELVGFYAESDTALPLQILPLQFAKMEELGLLEVFQMECDLIPLLVQMRLAGVSVDLDAAERARDQFLNSAAEVQKKVDEIAGHPINTGSAQEIAKVFDRLHIKYPRTEKTDAPSFKGEFLKTVEHPIGALIVELEELKKYTSTFIDNAILGSHINGKIHGEFNPLRAVTGRMSASNPNLQQVPSRNDLAKMVRAIFIPDEGHDHWRKYDYSSIESRILAHDAVGRGAKALRKEYRDNPNTDYHDFTIKMIHSTVGILLDRKPAKTINFGILYGMMVKALAAKLSISLEEAEKLFNTYHDGLPYVKDTMDHFSSLAEADGEIRTILGRRTIFDRWEPKYCPRGQEKLRALKFDEAVRAYGPNIVLAYTYKALNYRIQGSAADLMKAAMVKCFKDGVYDSIGVPRLVVHDEKDWSVKPDWDESAFAEMQNIMENVIKFRVPIRVEGEWGPNWSQLYSLKDK
jgi:DNA polymerase-1